MATIYNMALFTCGEISIEMKILLIVVFCYFMLLADSFSMIMSFNSIIILLYRVGQKSVPIPWAL